MTAPATALRVPPGDPGALADAALELDQAARNADDYSAETAAEAAAALAAADWTGDAADGFRAYARAQAGQEERVSPALGQIAGALADYATQLHRVQEQARAGIALAQGSAHQPSPDPTTYDAGLAEVSAAWARYETAADEAAARIPSAEAALPAPDAVRHPQPAQAPVPWFDKVGDWFGDRADDVERELHDAAVRAKDFLEYLAEHPDAVADLSRDGALLVFGAFLMALGASAEGAGVVLIGTGGGTPGGIALTLAGAEAVTGAISIALGALAAAKDLGKAYADSGGSNPNRPQRLRPSQSPVWKNLKPWRGKEKTNGLSGKRFRMYNWDYRHGEIEVYDINGKHVGVIDPVTGEFAKGPVPGRTIRK